MDNVGIYTPPKTQAEGEANIASTFSPILNNQDLEVTESAQAKLGEIISQSEEDIAGIRIYVGGGGCGGMSYGMTFTDEISEFDTLLEFDDFKVMVDVVALNYLRGAQVDYVQDMGSEKFVFNNVFAETGGSGVCGGCGAAGGGCA